MNAGFTSIEIFAAAGPVLLSAGLSLTLHLGIHRAMLIAALRMAVQLVLVGLLLRAIFASNSPWLTLGLLAIMITAASYEVGARQQRRLAGFWNFLVSGAAVSSATILVAMFALASLASSSPDWASPQVAIPIAGIILGTAMSAGSVGLAALFNSVSAERNGIEARLALGHTRRQALNPLLRRAVHTGTIPVINQMAGAGIITLPGIMSGQVLAGQDPLIAAQSQIFLMFLLCAASVCSVVIIVSLTLRRLSDDRHRLRLDRLEAMRS